MKERIVITCPRCFHEHSVSPNTVAVRWFCKECGHLIVWRKRGLPTVKATLREAQRIVDYLNVLMTRRQNQ